MAKKPIKPKKPVKKVIVSSSKWDGRDKPLKGDKKNIMNRVKGLLKQSEKQEKELAAKSKKSKSDRKKSIGVGLLQKTKTITSGRKVPKSVKSNKRKKNKAPRKQYVYVNEYLQNIKVYKKRGKLKPADVEELKRVKKNLQNNTYRIKAVLAKSRRSRSKKNKLNKTQRNKLHKKLRNLSVAVRGLNIKLGIKKSLKKIPKKKSSTKKVKEKKGKKEVQKVIKKEYMPVWEAQPFLTELLKGKEFKTYIVDGKEMPAAHQPEIFLALTGLEDSMHGIGSSTPHVIFYMRITDKICEITAADYN